MTQGRGDRRRPQDDGCRGTTTSAVRATCTRQRHGMARRAGETSRWQGSEAREKTEKNGEERARQDAATRRHRKGGHNGGEPVAGNVSSPSTPSHRRHRHRPPCRPGRSSPPRCTPRRLVDRPRPDGYACAGGGSVRGRVGGRFHGQRARQPPHVGRWCRPHRPRTVQGREL